MYYFYRGDRGSLERPLPPRTRVKSNLADSTGVAVLYLVHHLLDDMNSQPARLAFVKRHLEFCRRRFARIKVVRIEIDQHDNHTVGMARNLNLDLIAAFGIVFYEVGVDFLNTKENCKDIIIRDMILFEKIFGAVVQISQSLPCSVRG